MPLKFQLYCTKISLSYLINNLMKEVWNYIVVGLNIIDLNKIKMFSRIPFSAQFKVSVSHRDNFHEIWKIAVKQQHPTLQTLRSAAEQGALLQLTHAVAYLLAQLLGMSSSQACGNCTPSGSSSWLFNSWAMKKGVSFFSYRSRASLKLETWRYWETEVDSSQYSWLSAHPHRF